MHRTPRPSLAGSETSNTAWQAVVGGLCQWAELPHTLLMCSIKPTYPPPSSYYYCLLCCNWPPNLEVTGEPSNRWTMQIDIAGEPAVRNYVVIKQLVRKQVFQLSWISWHSRWIGSNPFIVSISKCPDSFSTKMQLTLQQNLREGRRYCFTAAICPHPPKRGLLFLANADIFWCRALQLPFAFYTRSFKLQFQTALCWQSPLGQSTVMHLEDAFGRRQACRCCLMEQLIYIVRSCVEDS